MPVNFGLLVTGICIVAISSLVFSGISGSVPSTLSGGRNTRICSTTLPQLQMLLPRSSISLQLNTSIFIVSTGGEMMLSISLMMLKEQPCACRSQRMVSSVLPVDFSHYSRSRYHHFVFRIFFIRINFNLVHSKYQIRLLL